jgi:hypothetical protein
MESKKAPEIICRVTRPELTPAEKAERMAEIKKAATGLVAATMRNKAQATRLA